MQGKSALTTYRGRKEEIRKEHCYDNSRGSSLLFEARTGVLRTRTYRTRYEECIRGVPYAKGKTGQ